MTPSTVIPRGRWRGTHRASLFVLAVSVLLAPSLARAESTKEIYTDAGFYSPNQNLFIYNAPSQTINALDNTAPEGQKSFVTHQVAGQFSGWGVYNVAAPNTFTIVPQNYSDYAGGSLRFWLKSTIALRITIEYGTLGAQPTGVTVGSTGNVWTEQVIPISAFAPADLTQVAAAFIAVGQPTGAVDYYVDHIRWTKPLGSVVVFPGVNTAAPANHREFIAEGRGIGSPGSSELVDVYPTWNVPPLSGATLSTGGSASRYTILTMGNSNMTISAVADGITGSAGATLASAAPTPFGIVSETYVGPNSLTVDTDSKLLALLGTTVSDDTVDFVEGTKSTKAHVTGSLQGWFVQWGLGTPDSDTKDMSAFYDGSIRFWFKAPASFQNQIQVSIRSGNVPGGSESSINVLAAAVCDNTWHQVVIPLAPFAKAAPWADLSRTKVFFAIQTIGAVTGDFWVDNVRWDATAPGALASIVVSPPSPVLVPLGGNRNFTAQGFDATGLPVDILPTWSMTPSLGTLTGNPGTTVTLAALSTPVSGTLSATFAGITGTANVNVAAIAITQTTNIFSDAGSGGFIGTSVGTAGGNTMLLNNLTGGSAPGSTHYMHANWTLVNTPGLTDAFSVWYVVEPNNGSRFMQPYSNGYLQFWVRTTTDLQFSISSANIPPGTELCKFRLSQFGIPTDGNWQQVTLSLDSFHTADPRLDFSKISTYFTVGVLSNQIGAGSGSFDIANVLWLTASTTAIDPNKVYAGLVAKQNTTTGLVLSFDGDATLQAVTYDQALAAMNYTYQGDTALAKKIFDTYATLSPANGFFDGYNQATKVVLPNMNARSVGPNAWMLLALIHYRNATGQTTYDAMINSLAGWLLSLQDTDGGVLFGFDSGGVRFTQQKSTEHNLDCYAAFNAYYGMTGNLVYQTAAQKISTWLATVAWNPGFGRFNVGITLTGTVNTDKALDTYSWAPLATSSYTAVLVAAKADFENSKANDRTGFLVDGFDMGGDGFFGTGLGDPASYKDAVWLEGTAQMVAAYWSVKDQPNASHFINEIEKAIFLTSPLTQGLTYATNNGTGFGGFKMNSLDAAVSSDAWYLFAKNRFNPFRPFAALNSQVKNISNNQPASSILWNATVGGGWQMAGQYIELTFQPITSQNTAGGTGGQGSPDAQGNLWQTRIYTDNTGAGRGTAAFPQWQDPTPAVSSNTDSNPAGLTDVPGSTYTFHTPLTLAWSVKDSTDAVATGIAAGDPATSAQWLAMFDSKTPWIDLNGNGVVDASDIQSVPGNPSQDPIIVQKGNLMHSAQGPAGFFDSLSPTTIYLEADFRTATSGSYKAVIYLESFSL